MTGPKLVEKYKKGNDVINFVIYDSTKGPGEDEVLQHKTQGVAETAHITLHPDGTVHFRVVRIKATLENAVRGNLLGYTPALSKRLIGFLAKVRAKI